ncbi:MAG: hypothetical protein ACE5JH_02145 [Acidobacteriota bacterium]
MRPPDRSLQVSSLLLFAAATLLAAGPADPYRIHPGRFDTKKAEHPPRPGPVRYVLNEVVVAVQYLEPADRAAFVASISAGLRDPFAVAPGRPERYHAFRITFENRSSADLVFQPGHAFVVTDRGERAFPIDLTDLYLVASRGGLPDPEAAMNRIAPVIYDSSVEIPAGAGESRMLVFGAFPDKWREFRLTLGFVEIGSEPHSLSFPFHRHAKKG